MNFDFDFDTHGAEGSALLRIHSMSMYTTYTSCIVLWIHVGCSKESSGKEISWDNPKCPKCAYPRVLIFTAYALEDPQYVLL